MELDQICTCGFTACLHSRISQKKPCHRCESLAVKTANMSVCSPCGNKQVRITREHFLAIKWVQKVLQPAKRPQALDFHKNGVCGPTIQLQLLLDAFDARAPMT